MSRVVDEIFYNSQFICIHILIHTLMNVSTKVYAQKVTRNNINSHSKSIEKFTISRLKRPQVTDISLRRDVLD